MKRLITALIGSGLIFTCHSYAFSNSCADAGYSSGLCSPKSCGGFYFGLTGAYLLATGTGADLNSAILQFADTSSSIAGTTGEFRSELAQFRPRYHFAYEITAGYDLPCSANNVELSYMHLNDHTTNLHRDLTDKPVSVASYFFTNILIPVFPANTGVATAGLTDLNCHASLRYKFDKIDLTFGRQYNDVCGYFNFHPLVGVRYARIHHDYRSETTGAFADEPIIGGIFADSLELRTNVRSEFKGAGPMFGLDTRYGFCGGFGIVGHFDTSLLVGTVDSNDHLAFTFTPTLGGGLTEIDLPLPSANESFNVPSRDRLVASFSGKLGIDYNYCFCNKSSLCVEVGYQACKYFDTFDLIRGDIQSPFSSVITGLPTVQRITETVTDSFDMRGPYVNVTYHL